MKLSVALGFGRTGVATAVDLAQRFERAGVQEVLIEEAWREPVVPLTAVALGTSRVGIGTAIAQIFPIHPVVAAQQAAQIDELAPGRLTLGFGVGAGFVIERWFGLDYQRPLTRMREFVEVVRGVLESPEAGPFSYTGSIFRVHKYSLRLSATAVKVPIHIAAVGPKMQELAGEVADGVIVGALHSPQYMSRLRERIAVGAERAGRDPDEVAIRFFVPTAASDDRERAIRVARASIVYTSQYPHYRRVLEEEGYAAEVTRISELARAHRHEEAQAQVTDELLGRFALAGTAKECLEQIRRYDGYPGHPVLFTVPFGVDEQDTVDSLAHLADGLGADIVASSP